MEIITTEFKDLLIIKNKIFSDERGVFFESFHESNFRMESGLNISFVQDNVSRSSRHVLRGLHYQIPPKGQAKLVTVMRGSVLDVVVDLRLRQPTFGKVFTISLSSENYNQLFIPEGFAHGFFSLEDETLFSYKCSNYYSPQHERCIRWNSPGLQIAWPAGPPIVSAKDDRGIDFADYEGEFF